MSRASSPWASSSAPSSCAHTFQDIATPSRRARVRGHRVPRGRMCAAATTAGDPPVYVTKRAFVRHAPPLASPGAPLTPPPAVGRVRMGRSRRPPQQPPQETPMETLAESRWIHPYALYSRRPGSASRPGPRHSPRRMPRSCHTSHASPIAKVGARGLLADSRVYSRVHLAPFCPLALVWLLHNSSLRGNLGLVISAVVELH